MPTATASEAPAFVRRTTLGANEYHTNFRKLDCETITRLTSEEATRITTQMCKVYLSLVNAPTAWWEREGVLRFAGEEREGRWVTAWEQLVSLLGVASATARKALRWMHEQGIVGYFAGKNGVGIRVFLNRAASSVGRKPPQAQKNLRLVRTSSEGVHTSSGDTPFNDSYAVSEVLETDLNPGSPKSGAEKMKVVKKYSEPRPASTVDVPRDASESEASYEQAAIQVEIPLDEIISRLSRKLEPSLQAAAERAAAREHERTREWLESRGLPKAARVAQRETYNVLRRNGRENCATGSELVWEGREGATPARTHPLSRDEVRELAEACLTMLDAHGRSIDETLAGLGAGAGGTLLPDDVENVRELAVAMARGRG